MAGESPELWKLMELEKAGSLSDADEEKLSALLGIEANAKAYRNLRKVEDILPEAYPAMEISQAEKDRLFAARMGGRASSATAPTVPRPVAPRQRPPLYRRLALSAGGVALTGGGLIAGILISQPPALIGAGGEVRSFHCVVKGAVREENGTEQAYELSDLGGEFTRGYWMEPSDRGAVGLTQAVPFKGKLCVQKDPAGCTKWEEEAVFQLLYQCVEEEKPKGRR